MGAQFRNGAKVKPPPARELTLYEILYCAVETAKKQNIQMTDFVRLTAHAWVAHGLANATDVPKP